MQDLYSITAAPSLLILPVSFWKAWRDALWIPVLPFLLVSILLLNLSICYPLSTLSLSVSLGRYFQLCEWCGRSGSTSGVIRKLLRAVPWGSHPRGEVRELENYRTDDVTGVWIWRMCFICPQRRMLSTQGAKRLRIHIYVARTKIAHMALYSIFTRYTGRCVCIIYSYTIISSDLQQ